MKDYFVACRIKKQVNNLLFIFFIVPLQAQLVCCHFLPPQAWFVRSD